MPSRKMSGIVFNSMTITHFFNHFNIIKCPFLNPLCLNPFFLFPERVNPFRQLFSDMLDCLLSPRHCCHIVARRVYGNPIQSLHDFARKRIDLLYGFNSIPEEY